MRSKRVKFVSDEAKPTLALGILEELFNSPSDQQCIFSKNNADLLDLLEYLAKIKVLLLKPGEKFEKSWLVFFTYLLFVFHRYSSKKE